MNGLHPPEWLDQVAWTWIVLSVISGCVIALHILAGHKQKMAVMNVVWPISALYFGPFALWAYWNIGVPEKKDKPFWQTVLVGDSHCGAGCTIGDFAGEWLVFLTGLTVAGSVLWADYAIDFVFAYLTGLFFQYLAIAPMRHISGWEGVKAAIKADTISLIAFEIGMFAWMAFSKKVLFRPALKPTQAPYWFSMQIAMVVGFATAIPANWWLIRRGLKEAM